MDLKKEGIFLASMTRMVYEEHYLSNCKAENISSIPMRGFFMTKEFSKTLKAIPENVIEDIRNRATIESKK
jgi:hypothetical protein